MAPRLELHSLLQTFAPNVYFQPPTNITLSYPCILYSRNYAAGQFADNLVYSYTRRYMITVIDRDPDSEIPDKIAAMPMSVYNRFYVSDDLNHDVFNVYY